jgi:hypothetical protein
LVATSEHIFIDRIMDMDTKSLDKNLTFESLLGEISAKVVNLPLESIDVAIESSLKSIVEFFEADRCHLGKLSDDQSKIVIPYFYSRPGKAARKAGT